MTTLNKIVVGTGSDFSLLLDRTKNKDEQSITDDQTKLDNQMTALHTRYLAQFTAMQNILNSTKTDQTSLTNMMTAWSAGLKG
jgi:flagellar capping protein FliD